MHPSLLPCGRQPPYPPHHRATGLCRPVCEQGCVNGTCVEPNRCRCHFGHVGRNCSAECRCNRHSDCLGEGRPDHCLQCHNNTMVPTPHCGLHGVRGHGGVAWAWVTSGWEGRVGVIGG